MECDFERKMQQNIQNGFCLEPIECMALQFNAQVTLCYNWSLVNQKTIFTNLQIRPFLTGLELLLQHYCTNNSQYKISLFFFQSY